MIFNLNKYYLLIIIALTSLTALAQHREPKNLNYITHELSVSSADFDLDGDIDVVVASGTRDVLQVYLNLDGLGTLDTGMVLSNQLESVTGVMAADMDNDGDSDIVISSYGFNMVAWYENLGSAVFAPIVVISSQVDWASSVFTKDIDSDGDMDVVTCSKKNGEVGWIENFGGGIFGTFQVVTNQANGVSCVFVDDIDGDGDNDICSSSEIDKKLAWYENLGGGVFGTQQVIHTFSRYIAKRITAADTDGDGDKDIFSVSVNDEFFSWTPDSSEISFFENLGGGNFGVKQVVDLNNSSGNHANFNSIACGDMDNDGDVDVIATPSRQTYYENLGGNVFQSKETISGQAEYGLHIANLDGDTLNDILNGSNWRRNQSNLFASSTRQYYQDGINMGVTDMVMADFDGDGLQDAITVSPLEKKIELYKNINGDTLGIPTVVDSFNTAWTLAKIDIDGDLDVDVLSRGFESMNVYVYVNDGNGSFTKVLVKDSLIANNPFLFGEDVDLDGDDDIIVGGIPEVVWIENLGGLTFGAPQLIANISGYISIGDIDGDGDVDMLKSVNAASADIEVYENTGIGSGVFSLKQTIGGGFANGLRAISNMKDMDQDGDLDYVTSMFNSSTSDCFLQWHENDGTGTITNSHLIKTFPPVFVSGEVNNTIIHDVDEDGINDVIYTYYQVLQITPLIYEGGIFCAKGLGGGAIGSHDYIYDEFGSKWYEMSFTAQGNLGTVDFHVVDFDNDGDEELCRYRGARFFLFDNPIFGSKQARGKIYVDQNQDGILDSNETGHSWLKVQSVPTYDYSYTYGNGDYIVNFKDTSGVYQIMPDLPNYWSITSDSLLYHVNVDTNFQYVDSLDFGVYPDSIVDSIGVNLVGGLPRCNIVTTYWLQANNYGTTILDGLVHLELDTALTYMGSSTTPDSINGQNIYWHFDSLYYFSNSLIDVYVQMPNFMSIGDTMTSLLKVSGLDSLGGITITEVDTLNQLLICAYDPNDKIANPEGRDSLGYIPQSTSYIDYTIRFQNTGNDTAINVTIEDQLDSNLLWNTVSPLASSDQMIVNITPTGLMIFSFNNIMLPDSGADFLGSQGFVKYRVGLKQNLPPGTQILNTAGIYFDQNPPVITNTKVHTIDTLSSVSIREVNGKSQLIIYPNPTKDLFTIQFPESENGVYNVYLYDIVGKQVYSRTNINSKRIEVRIGDLPQGVYQVIVMDNNSSQLFTGRIVHN